MTAPEVAFITAAGIMAGIVGTAGGITSLISYPALLAAGVPPFPANVANIVALVACWPGSALASRPELAGRASWVWRWAWVTAAGGALGAVLLLATPPAGFRLIVPFLVVAGSLALLLQPRFSSLRGQARDPEHGRDPERDRAPGEGRRRGGGPGLLAGLLSVSAYCGYFGAGSGVLTLSLLLHTVDPHLARANALKNMLIGATSVLSAIVFIAVGAVDWAVALPLGLGMFAGSMIGPRLARRVPARILRWLVALLGIVLAVSLWVAPSG